MRLVRYITAFIFAFLLIGSINAFANTNGTEKDKKNKTEVKSSDENPAPDPDEETGEAVDQESKTIEPVIASVDSTSNSLNKLNFIFYFIYKHKYESPSEAISRLFD